MTQEFEHAAGEPKDYTKYVWGGVGLLVVGMIAVMLATGGGDPRRSEVKTKHILIQYDQTDPADRARALELITSLREQIVRGEATFEEIAEKYSDDPTTAHRGGYLGTHGKGEMQTQYENYSWTAPVGELSGVIQTSFGYHLMMVLERYISPGDAYEQELERRIQEGEELPQVGDTEAPAGETPAPATETQPQ
jgi:parvulin-like peptidyl-prolyl isomerase